MPEKGGPNCRKGKQKEIDRQTALSEPVREHFRMCIKVTLLPAGISEFL